MKIECNIARSYTDTPLFLGGEKNVTFIVKREVNNND